MDAPANPISCFLSRTVAIQRSAIALLGCMDHAVEESFVFFDCGINVIYFLPVCFVLNTHK